MVAPVTNSNASSKTTAGPAADLTSAADQQDRFMKLLVAQMRNQDPLSPMDNAQMTSQIAQINTVGGIEKLNATVTSLLGAFSRMQVQSATQLTGREVLVSGSDLELVDGRAIGGVELAGKADTVTAEVIDAAGFVVGRIDLGASPAGSRPFGWDGKLPDGTKAPEGTYKLRVSATLAGKTVETRPLMGAQVRAVSSAADGTVILDLGSAGLQPMDAVRSYL